MDPQELIQVNLQLPASVLDSLTRLAEQLRLLTAQAGSQEHAGTGQTLEQGENRFFDPAQFRALRQETEMAEVKEPPTAGYAVEQTLETETVTAQVPDGTPEAHAVRSEMRNDVYTPKDAGHKVEQEVEDPAQAGSPPDSAPADAETVVPDMQDPPSTETIRQSADSVMEEILAVQAESHPLPNPEVVQIEPESQIPEAETVWGQVKTLDYESSIVQAGVSDNIDAPMNAGFTPAEGPDTPRSRWAGGTETLAVWGGSPLTAEDISLAFQRDERRYDNGFPLY